jgi:hypothetical protein
MAVGTIVIVVAVVNRRPARVLLRGNKYRMRSTCADAHPARKISVLSQLPKCNGLSKLDDVTRPRRPTPRTPAGQRS